MDFLYKLQLVERLWNDDNWTEADEKVVGTHFQHLKKWTEEGRVLMAGRTTNEAASSFGIVLIRADDEVQAKEMMEQDPAIKNGIMKGVLFPFHLALSSESRPE